MSDAGPHITVDAHKALRDLADLLPNEMEGTIQAMIDFAATTMKKTLDATAQ